MTADIRVVIAGSAVLEPRDEIPLALEEMIYTVVSRALDDAGMSIDEIDGVCMSASDLNDGRAISTMTLTGSTGSLGKNELRVCNDSLAAMWLASAELRSGAARALVVCTWNKLSDATPDAIKPLALEPAFHRDLGFHPDAIVALRESVDTGSFTFTAPGHTRPSDSAGAVILTGNDHVGPRDATVRGFGSAMGPYLRPGTPLLEPLRSAASRACQQAGTSPTELSFVMIAGLQEVTDAALSAALGVPAAILVRAATRWADVGYAAGLLGVISALDSEQRGLSLVVSAGGIGLENAYAAVVQTS
jgi:hypothetical protein